MITETGQLNPYLETDNEEYKELVDLYNNWYDEICFLSNCNWLDTNENWKKMHEYCNEHKDILKNSGQKCIIRLVKLAISHLC